jgi:hypothetical protein
MDKIIRSRKKVDVVMEKREMSARTELGFSQHFHTLSSAFDPIFSEILIYSE